jgi:hypothetical protein
MFNFIKKHALRLQSVFLILMLVIPFLLYYFAHSHSEGGVAFFLVLMGVVMLVVMKS